MRLADAPSNSRTLNLRKPAVVVIPNAKRTTNATPLHHLQTPVSGGSTFNNSCAIMETASARIELPIKVRSRNLSSGDHSCTESR